MTKVYYRVLPDAYHKDSYTIEIWRWWWPFWCSLSYSAFTSAKAAEFIRCHQTYYDGAE